MVDYRSKVLCFENLGHSLSSIREFKCPGPVLILPFEGPKTPWEKKNQWDITIGQGLPLNVVYTLVRFRDVNLS